MGTKRRRAARRTKIGDLLQTAILGILAIAAAGLWLLPLVIPDRWAGFVTGLIVGPMGWAWLREFLFHHGKQLGFKVVFAPGRTPKAKQRVRAGEDEDNPRPKPRRNGGQQ